MSRPPGAPFDPSPNGPLIDAVNAARSGMSIERHFKVDLLPRLREASVDGATDLTAKFEFSLLEGQPAIDGAMSGTVRLKCQRCLQPVAVPIDEDFRIVLVADESVEVAGFGGYEPVAVDVTRLDLQWLAEEQTLLALPLVPLHEPGECEEAEEVPTVDEPVAPEPGKQKPFSNLRELLQKR